MKKTFLLLAATCCLVMNSWSTYFELYVAGIKVTDENKNAITGTGITGSVSFNSETSTLTLDNASIEYTGTGECMGVIQMRDMHLYIKCIGENTIVGKGSYGIGIKSEISDIDITGTGKLSVKGDAIGVMYINIGHALFINGCEVTIEGGNGAIYSHPNKPDFWLGIYKNGTLLAKGDGKNVTIQNCTKLSMSGLDFLTETTWDATNNKFLDKSGNESKGDIKIGPKQTGIENVNANVNASRKVMRDGQLLIIRDSKTYNAVGQEL